DLLFGFNNASSPAVGCFWAPLTAAVGAEVHDIGDRGDKVSLDFELIGNLVRARPAVGIKKCARLVHSLLSLESLSSSPARDLARSMSAFRAANFCLRTSS